MGAPALLVALAGSLVAALPASAGLISPESGGSPNADDIATLYNLVLVIAVFVFIGVEGVLIWCLVKFKARKGATAAQIHGNTRLEIGWTVAAALILVLITAVTFVMLPGIRTPPGSSVDAEGNPVAATTLYAATDRPDPPDTNALNIRVDGQQYIWRYQYPGPEGVFSYEEMVVPAGRTVTLDITADDVAHSWWIPELGGKFDAIPGYVNKTWFKASDPATYTGQCAELCGRNHANMLARVTVLEPAAYQRWYEGKARQIKAARDDAAQQRRALEREQGAEATEGSEGSGGAASTGGG